MADREIAGDDGMTAGALVLSLFPSADLLGLAFEREGFSVVTGPDVIFGRDIRAFHVPAGRFDGIIGGPPCQSFSPLVHLVRANGHEPRHGNLIPEFERVVDEAQPAWFLMEEVPQAPLPSVDGYAVHSSVIDNSTLCDGTGIGHAQMRKRRFSFGLRGQTPMDLRRWITYAALELPDISPVVTCDARDVEAGTEYRAHTKARTVRGKNDGNAQPWELAKARAVVARELAGGISEEKALWQREHKRSGLAPGNRRARSWAECCRLQGVPEDWLSEGPFTKAGRFTLLGNGVALPSGRAIARAVKAARETMRRID